MRIREAIHDDIPAITALYNALIPTTTIGWTEALQTNDQRTAWFERQRASSFPVLVADSGDAEGVVGFASYGHFRGAGVWPGYRFTVEHTIHVGEGQWGRGVGRQLIDGLLERAARDGIHVMVGAIDGDNAASIEFHRRLGFVAVARLPEVGFKFGRWLDLVLMQRIVGADANAAST